MKDPKVRAVYQKGADDMAKMIAYLFGWEDETTEIMMKKFIHDKITPYL